MEPPPVVKLDFRNSSTEAKKLAYFIFEFSLDNSESFICKCQLVDASSLSVSELEHSMFGNVVSTGLHVKGTECVYFTFPDLSIKQIGCFKLRFSIFNLAPHVMESGSLQGFLISKPFTVYSKKMFPGSLPSTALTKELAKFGMKTYVRYKGTKK